jgi:hypothetical protein
MAGKSNLVGLCCSNVASALHRVSIRGWYAEERCGSLRVGKDDFCVDKKANDLPEWRHIFFI